MPVLFIYVQLLIGECLIQLISCDTAMHFLAGSFRFFSTRACMFLFLLSFFGRATSLLFCFWDREASKCEESSCLRMLLDKRDAWLGPWNPGRYLALKSWNLFIFFCGSFCYFWGCNFIFSFMVWLMMFWGCNFVLSIMVWL